MNIEEQKKQRVAKIMLVTMAFTFLFVQGCATIVKGRTQEVTFKSEPEGATVTVTGRALGKTPITVQLDRKSDQVATFEKEGYKSQTVPLTTTITGWFWGNIVIGGLIGSTTDGVTGAFHEYSPSHYHITLPPTTERTARDSIRSDAKTFIISNYKDIYAELNSQPGKYVSSLISILRIPLEKQEDFIKDIKDIVSKYTDIVDFAEQVIKQYVPQ
jgi:hypothetical protein